jgi:hypothetical protein
MRQAHFWCHFACLTLLTAFCRADETGLPRPVVPDGLGVNIHFTDPAPGEMARFAEAGYRFDRNDLAWAGIERQAGEYDFSAYDRLVGHLKSAGARPLFILDYGNPLYDRGQAPRSEAARAAFARFSAAAARHFRNQGVIWELWNEPNLSQFWKPDPDPSAYASLALETARAIRSADPRATILAPGSSGFPWDFLEKIFAAGLLEQIDAVSVHPYRGDAPESVLRDYGRLRVLIARHATPSRRHLPIISSEWGYTTATGALSEADQARYLARQWLVNLAAGVNLSIFYDWRDDGDDPADREARFGTVRRNLEPKPSFLAARTLIRSLSGFTLRHRLQGASESDWRLLFQKGEDHASLMLVEWSADPRAGEAARTPIYHPVDPAKDADGILAKLASVRWAPGPLAEQQEAPAELALDVVNPTSQPTRIRVEWGGSGGASAPPLELTVPPGGHANRPLVLPVPSLRAERRTVEIKIRWNDTLLPAVVPLDVWRADPIKLAVAPRGKDLEITIENPSGHSVSGTLSLRDHGGRLERMAVRIESGNREARVRVHAPTGLHEIEFADNPGRLLATAGSARYEPFPGFASHREPAPAFESILFVDNAARPAHALRISKATGTDPPAPSAFTVEYTFDAGWRYLVVAPRRTTAIVEGAQAAIFWIKGNSSGDALRCRIRDATGQTFQPDLGTLNWTDWRPVRIDLRSLSAASHWGGAGDGVPHPPLSWEALLLIDSSRRGESTPRSVELAAPSYVLNR